MMKAPQPDMDSLPGGSETILIVEDEQPIQRVLDDFLRRLGYTVVLTSSGEEALEKFKKDPAAIHLLLADIMLPDGMNGLEVAKAFRQIRPNIPICYMTGYDRAVVMLEKCEEAGEWLHKPFRIEKLAARVRASLDQPHS
ncbi:MAG: response regulator [Verrucomicrobiae bacterium]|nr:response regulator [Verrucomicrobiae bacterium]